MLGCRERIKVIARIRPLVEREREMRDSEVLSVQGQWMKVAAEEFLRGQRPGSSKVYAKQFEFDGSYGHDTTTRTVYDSSIRELVLRSMIGFNCAVLLYGQTGSGKTYTLSGSVTEARDKSPVRKPDNKSPVRSRTQNSAPTFSVARGESIVGLLQMAVRDIFQEAERLTRASQKLFVSLSYIELYNEGIYDLLRETRTLEEPLIVTEDVERGEFFVKGCRKEIVTSLSEAGELLRRGEANRRFAETALNHHSSRSHTIFRIFFEFIDESGSVCHSMCNFVDLAGSERLSRGETDETARQRATEGKHINKSLFFLTQLIQQLSASRVPAHVPYRNSSLTKLLKNSIGGNAKTLIVLCLHPGLSNIEQTLSTLRFGSLARTIENLVERNVLTTQSEESIVRLIDEFGQKINSMEKQLQLAANKEPLLAHIYELEAQKTFLQTQYKKLLFFNRKAAEASTEINQCRETIHLRSCGSVERYSTDACKRENPIVFTAMSDRNLALSLFREELIASLQRKKLCFEEAQVNSQKEIKNLHEENATLRQECSVLRRLLLVFLGENEVDHFALGKETQSLLTASALHLIDNTKTVQVLLSLPTLKAQYCELEYKRSGINPNYLLELLKGKEESNAQSAMTVSSFHNLTLVDEKHHRASWSLFSERKLPHELCFEKKGAISAAYLLQDNF